MDEKKCEENKANEACTLKRGFNYELLKKTGTELSEETVKTFNKN